MKSRGSNQVLGLQQSPVATAPLWRAGLISIDLAPEMATGCLQMADLSAVIANIPILLLPR